MKAKVSAEFIEKFRKEHNLDPNAYVKPTVQSEQVFAVNYDIRPFRLCANELRTHTGMVCFS
ncbi:MAG: hypothetical protein GX177_10035 [Firmicutes bacterium]|jgi:hypothetical protein|nr:hypothetical protein [Bacillota bacterium]